MMGKIWFWIFFVPSLFSQDGLVEKSLVVEGLERTGLVFIPPGAETEKTPLVFVFHGHGGNAASVAKSFGIHRLWPGAMVVYLQGLPAVGKLTDQEGKKTGWQNSPGDYQDRDVKLVEGTLGALGLRYKVDRRRIYATGHSHGGAFTYLLWAMRGGTFAAVAPVAALLGETKLWPQLTPKPVLHVAGQNDRLVKFNWQESMVGFVKKLNGCSENGILSEDGSTRIFPSESGTPVWFFVHGGGHELPPGAPAQIVDFFKSQMLVQDPPP